MKSQKQARQRLYSHRSVPQIMSSSEDASDAFVCLPNASDQALIADAFAALEAVYMGTRESCRDIAAKEAQRRVVPRELVDVGDTIDQESMFQLVVTRRLHRLARGLGISTESVFRFYVQKAMDDHAAGIPHHGSTYVEPYAPWLHIGFPLPFENVTFETTEDGLDWMRFGTIGPMPFGYTGTIPSHVHTICVKHTDDLKWYEVVFVGDQIDVADGGML